MACLRSDLFSGLQRVFARKETAPISFCTNLDMTCTHLMILTETFGRCCICLSVLCKAPEGVLRLKCL